MDKFITATILISVMVVLGYFVWPFVALYLGFLLVAALFLGGIRWIAQLLVPSIKKLYPKAKEDRLEMDIVFGIFLLTALAIIIGGTLILFSESIPVITAVCLAVGAWVIFILFA